MPEHDSKLIGHLFRHHYGRMVAGLTRVFGPARIDLVEDVVQEALLKACCTWPFQGVPDKPEAWLVKVARNLATDVIRRGKLAERVEQDLRTWGASAADQTASRPEPDQVDDDSLRMIFTCCHPVLPEEMRVALTLKTLCGFGVSEVARALRAKDATVAQRLSRAKARLQTGAVEFAVPAQNELSARLDSVLAVLYLMFNEGYAAHRGDDLIRRELAFEALRLGRLLLQMPQTALPKVYALVALMLFQSSRLPARLAEDGSVRTLALQDRTRWDQAMICSAFEHLRDASAGPELTPYHAEAAIASMHAMAPSYAATDWRRILALYDQLAAVRDSGIVHLNRAVAVAKAEGIAAGLAALDAVTERRDLAGYHLLPATRGMLLWHVGRSAEAAACFERAIDLAGTAPERRLLSRRLAACQNEAAPEEL